MKYLAHTAHRQFLGLIAGILAWIIIMATVGLNEWRLWQLADVSVVTSGVAWVGIWRACFYSHVLPKAENCHSIRISDPFAPAEIHVAQVLMMLAVISGLAANICAASATRMAYFTLEDRRNIRPVFVLAGTLYVLTAVFCLVPLLWNMSSVLNNSIIDFPPEFHLPAPVKQQVGSAIGLGLFASVLMLISGILFLCYRYIRQGLSPELAKESKVLTLSRRSVLSNNTDNQGVDNLAFYSGETS